jgi:glycosyl transferase family 25
MKIFIINLPNAIERRQFQEEQLSKLDLDYEILKATSIDGISDKKYDKHYFDWQRPLRNSEVACYFSHRSAWQKIIDNNIPALILEDDALLSKHTPDILNSISELSHIDLVQLEIRGRKKLIKDHGNKISSTHTLYRLYQDRTGAAGYVLWPSGAKKLLEHESVYGIGLADANIASCYNIKSYQVEPAAIIQLDQCHYYSMHNPYARDLSKSTVSSTRNPKGSFYFWKKRISAQLKIGLHMVKILSSTRSSRRFIRIRSDDFL